MARSFTGADNEYLKVDTPFITSYPFSMSCWFKATNLTDGHSVMFVGRTDVGDFWTSLLLGGNVAGDPVRAISHSYGIGNLQTANTSIGYTVDTWHHACGVWTDVDNRDVYLDGGNVGHDGNTVGPLDHSTPAATAIGKLIDSTPGGIFDGLSAELGWFNVALTPADAVMLAARFSPLFFLGKGLVDYHALGGVYDANDGDHDIVGALDMTAFSDGAGPSTADHPPGMIYPSRAMGQFISAPVGFVPSRVIGRGILQGVYG